MRTPKLLFFALFFPLTLFLDYLLFASGTKCSGCGNFGIWLSSPESFSFPIITAIYTTSNNIMNKFKK